MKQQFSVLNHYAITLADHGELYKAQCMFRQNAIKHRCLMTLNNLAVFYCENNLVDKNERERDGKSLALHYFTQALALKPTDKTFFATAIVHYKCGNFIIAADYFKMAFKLKNSAVAAFNCGVAQYHANEYLKAATCFEKALQLSNTNNRGEVLVAYAFATVYAGNQLSESVIAKIENSDEDYEKFFLAYALGDDAKAMQYLNSVKEHFSLSSHEYAIIIELLLRHGAAEQANTYVQQEIECLKKQKAYRDIRVMRQMLSNSSYRSEQIHAYRYPLALMRQCCYIDCPEHG